MPCYNERETVEECVAAVLESQWVKELIIVDDGSTDGTREILTGLGDQRIHVVLQPQNGGKGSALRTGFAAATAEFVIVQDADLEYEPADYDKILRPLVTGKADVVFGSRFAGGEPHRVVYFWHMVGKQVPDACVEHVHEPQSH